MALLRLIAVLTGLVFTGSLGLAVASLLVGTGFVAMVWIGVTVAAIASAANRAIAEPRPRSAPHAVHSGAIAPAGPPAHASAHASVACTACGADATGLRRCRRCATPT